MLQIRNSLIICLVFATAALAANKPGSKCGLTDNADDDSWIEVGPEYNLSRANKKTIERLPTLVKQQLIITAKQFSKDDEDTMIENTLQAVYYLRQGDGLNVYDFKVKGKRYTQVLTYPGDIPTV